MFLKYSLQNTVRSWRKTALFFILIAALVMVSCIGVSLTVSIGSFLRSCDRTYTTVALFEYMGAAYPDETIYDPGIASCLEDPFFSSLGQSPFVESWDPSQAALGYIRGMTNPSSLAPDRDSGVLVVHVDGYKELEGVYSCTVQEALYSYRDCRGILIYVDTGGIPMERDHTYLLYGQFYDGLSSYTYFRLSPFVNAAAEAAGFDGSVDSMLEDVTPTCSCTYIIPEDSPFRTIADTYTVLNSSVTIRATGELEALLPFQQGTLYFTDGQPFTEEEYDRGSPVCVLSRELADILGVAVGDPIDLGAAVRGGCTLRESYWSGTGFTYDKSFTVVGIVNTQQELKYDVFIPRSNTFDLSGNHSSYTLGVVKLDNDRADEFVAWVTPQLPDRVRVTVYDQGYAAAAQPLKDILKTAAIVTGLCGAAVLAVAALFGFLFVYRQRAEAGIMRRLGVRRGQVFTYFLFGSGCIALAASAVGVAASFLLSERITDLLRRAAAAYAASDLHYSSGNLSMVKVAAFSPAPEPGVYPAVGAAVFLLAALSCLLFAAIGTHIRRGGRSHLRAKPGPAQTRHGSRSLRGGALRYALLSLRRGGLRSLIPGAVSLLAAVLLLELTGTAAFYGKQLDMLESTSDIRGYFTDMGGRRIGDLSVDGTLISDLSTSGYLVDTSVSKATHYGYMGISPGVGLPVESPELRLPNTPEGWETFLMRLRTGPDFVYTNDFLSVPEFYYSSQVTTEFMEGYDLSVFAQEVSGIPCCIVSTSFLEAHKLRLGDTIRVLLYDEKDLMDADLKVVGSYVKAGEKDNIYCQLGSYLSPGELFGGADPDTLRGLTFNSVSFHLQSGAVLPEIKSFLLGRGYSEVNDIRSIRAFVVLEDKVFMSTQGALSQRLWTMDRFYPALYILTELLAVLIPFLLIQLRRREIACMRGLGASKATAFFSVFWEQVMLCAGGTALAVLIRFASGRTFTGLGLILAGAFLFCWLLGTAFSVSLISRRPVQLILRAED